jgi:glycine betaine/proline transport system permease protein
MNTVLASSVKASPIPAFWTSGLIWALIVFVVGYVSQDAVPWLSDYPAAWKVPFQDWAGSGMKAAQVALQPGTRAIAEFLNMPLGFLLNLLARGFKVGVGQNAIIIPGLSWLGICLAAFFIGRAVGGWRLGSLMLCCLLFTALFGYWKSTMLTLGLIVFAVPVCVLTGLVLGIWAWSHPQLSRICILPALDLMQTIPTFAYLIPMLLLFGNSPVSAMLATAIFALPPMVRATTLGLGRVPQEIVDYATVSGCTRRQKIWQVLLPAARPTLMIGVNQVIMLALNMVIISSMIGAGGLGYDVLLALRALKVGQAMEAGLAIVAIAIALDRLSQAAARSTRDVTVRSGHGFWSTGLSRNLGLALIVLCATWFLSLWLPALASVPKWLTISSAEVWKAALSWITLNFFDYIEAFRVFVILWILNPIRALCLSIPWASAVAILAIAGFRLGGFPLAASVGLMVAFCAVSGLWKETMATVYLCGVSAVISCLIGIPLGFLAYRYDGFNRALSPVLDTLQTLPSFCFIIPIVMLFRVGDVTAMIATIMFAVVPAVRFTNHGLRQIHPSMIEAAITSGCSSWQVFRRVQVPLAMPEIMLGINQTILMALSMIIVCAMIGTRDLGQEVFIALTQGSPGRGIVAGLAIAFIGMTVDRLLSAWSAKARRAVSS